MSGESEKGEGLSLISDLIISFMIRLRSLTDWEKYGSPTQDQEVRFSLILDMKKITVILISISAHHKQCLG